MTKPILLQIGNVTERMKNRFDALFDVHVWFDQTDQDAFVDTHGADVVGIATDGHWGVPDNLLARLPNLKVVSSYGVGYDAIDADDAADRGILVSHTPNVLNNEVADTAIMLWLATSRRLVQADKWARSGQWERDGAFPLTRSVQKRQVGILGMGRIGETIAKRALGFDATIHYHSRTPKGVDFIYHSTVKELADAVDVLFVITPGGASTYHLVNDEVMNALGAEGMLINVARGSVVDETALVAALQDGRLGSAGLDVFEQEPKIPDALKDMENVVLLPHVGSASVETRQAMGDLTCENLERYMQDGTVVTPVPECAAFNGK
jgi:lactate dehydrogenase-like 2-hydroxyacid dehydrogenase